MSDLISRDALKSAMCEGCDGEACNRTTFDCYSMRAIIEAPTIDAEPIVHGHWRNNSADLAECSICGYIPQYDPIIDDIYYSNYCPDCGAKMDEVSE